MFLKMSAQASTAIGDHELWRVVVWGLGLVVGGWRRVAVVSRSRRSKSSLRAGARIGILVPVSPPLPGRCGLDPRLVERSADRVLGRLWHTSDQAFDRSEGLQSGRQRTRGDRTGTRVLPSEGRGREFEISPGAP